MAETVELAQVPDRTDGDSSANESGFAGHSLSTVFTPVQLAAMAFEEHAIVDEYPDEGVCYFVRKGNDGPIKIGFTKDQKQRWRTLRSSHGKDCVWLADRFGGRKRELVYHMQFDADALGYEWFYPSPELLAEIDAINNGERCLEPIERAPEVFVMSGGKKNAK